MGKRTIIGMLTPSSNTVLEPLTSQILADYYPEVTAHFGRFQVTEISLRDQALEQFDDQHILDAARLLADARPDVICWNGTSSGWLGFEADEQLCAAITEATGVAACTSVLALNEVLSATGAYRFGLVTPYLDDVQQRIINTYSAAGFECVSESHFGDRGNFSFSEYQESFIEENIRLVAQANPQAITTFCTNLRAARIAPRLEQELGIPIYDTITLAVWKSLRVAGVDTRGLGAWGSVFTAI